MSVIRKQPFVEKVIKSLSADDLVTLKTLINTNTVNTVYSIDNMPSSNGVYAADFMIESGKIYSSFLIKNASYTVVIAYHKYQDLSMFNIVNNEIKRVNEYLNINELRRIVDDQLDDSEDTGKYVSKTTEHNKVYGTDNSGDQKLYGATSDSDNGTIVVRDSNGSANFKGIKLDKTGESPKNFNYDNLLTKEEIQDLIGDLSAGINYKGSVASYDDLPDSSLTAGDTYVALDDGAQWTWDGTQWLQTGAARVVDDELSDNSTNPVQNKVVTAALDGKLGINSYSEGAGVGYADRASNIEPVSDDSGATQTEPFIMQGTGTANNTASVDTRPFAKLQEKRGNTIVVNQLAKELNSTNWAGSAASVSFSNNVATFTASAQTGSIYTSVSLIEGHKYFIGAEIKLTTGSTSVVLRHQNNSADSAIATKNTTDWQILYKTFTATSSSTATLQVVDARASDWDAIQVKEVLCIDLTQMFNGNIPADLLSHPDHFSWYYNGSLAYNTGELVNASGRYLINTGRQLWDEEWELGLIQYDKNQSNFGQNISSASNIRSKNYIIAIPNTVYYGLNKGSGSVVVFCYDKDKNPIVVGDSGYLNITNTSFTTPSNCHYIRFYCNTVYGTTYNNDITISLYYSTGDGYDQYYPYKGLKEYDTGNEVLRSAGSAYDVKVLDGTITRKAKQLNLASQSWTYYSDGGYFKCQISDMLASALGNQLTCDKYIPVNKRLIYMVSGEIKKGTNENYIYLKDSSLNGDISLITGTLNYPIEPTIEQGTPFTEDIEVDDYGMMYWLDSSNKLISIPQGNKIFYPVDYVLFIDSLHKLVDGDAEAILNTKMSQANFDSAMNSFGYYKQEDLSANVTLGTGFTGSLIKAYKTGNIVMLDISVRNTSGGSITTNSSTSPLATVSGGILPSKSKVVYCDNSGVQARCVILSSNGNIYLDNSAIANDTVVYITITYCVA